MPSTASRKRKAAKKKNSAPPKRRAAPKHAAISPAASPAASPASAVIDLTDDSPRSSAARAQPSASGAANSSNGSLSAVAAGAAVDLTGDAPPPCKVAAKVLAAAAGRKVAGGRAYSSSSASGSAGGSAGLRTAAADPGLGPDNVDLDEVYYGTLKTKIVGIRYYSGIVSNGENTRLQRQPSNSYDRNAIQVLTIGGEQVGHVPREVASLLAPQMDRLRDSMRAEGYIPSGSGNVYTIPMELALYGPAAARSTVGAMMQKLQRFGVRASVHNPADEVPPPKGKRHRAKKLAPTASEIVERQLEELYSCAARYEDMPEAAQPPHVRSELFLHQRKALAWMMAAEARGTVADELAKISDAAKRGSSSVFFWQQRPGGQFLNTATQSAVRVAPRLCRGGILADDMGLGKTLTCLSLIASDAAAAAPTLIVCPLSVLTNWEEQAKQHCDPAVMTCYTCHGPGRATDHAFLRKHRLVLTTYSTLAADFAAAGGGMLSLEWRRVVLDEGHYIKNRTTKIAKAAFALRAERRWLVTGTPIQNKLDDLFSALRFLRCAPFDELDWFNRLVLRPIKYRDPTGSERLHTVLSFLCLRRTKDMSVRDRPGAPLHKLVDLPTKTEESYVVQLDASEQSAYDALFAKARACIGGFLADGTLGSHYTDVLTLLLWLRELCCSAQLLPAHVRAAALGVGQQNQPLSAAELLRAATHDLGSEEVGRMLDLLSAGMDDDCCICLEPGGDCITRCKHVFHQACISRVLQPSAAGGGGGGGGAAAAASTSCPLCRAPICGSELLMVPTDDDAEQSTTSVAGAPEGAGSKSAAMLRYITQNSGTEGQMVNKFVVFSQFTRYLDLLEPALTAAGLRFVRLDGSKSASQRKAALEAFRDDDATTVFLVSLKAGGVGLNLTTANHVLLLDPWWNPAVEEQACDRIHRLGQARPVSVARFVAAGTIEEKMIELQDLKRQIMRISLDPGRSKASLQKLRLEMVSRLIE